RGEWAETVGEGECEGRAAIAVRSKGYVYGIDSKITLDERLYIDAETLLPFAQTLEHLASSGTVPPNSPRRYMHEFVYRAAVPASLFDPKDIVYEASGLGTQL